MKKIVTPVYQPIVDMETGDVVHYEALARVNSDETWHRPLIEMGEVIGFIDLIDIAMLEHVVDALRINARAKVAINVSGATIGRSCNDLLAAIFKHMECMRRVIFEITETAEICDRKMLGRFLTAVRLLEARVALDDFGTGFCTLAGVDDVRPEFVKISGALVDYIDSTGDLSAVKEMCKLVGSYGGHVIAENIDTKQKADLMQDLGIRLCQGFYVGGFLATLPDRESKVVSMSANRIQAAVG